MKKNRIHRKMASPAMPNMHCNSPFNTAAFSPESTSASVSSECTSVVAVKCKM